MKNSRDSRKFIRSKSAKDDISVIEFSKLHNGRRSVFNACIGIERSDEVNYPPSWFSR